MGVPQKQQVKLKELIKSSEGELIILQDYDSTLEIVKSVAEKYKDLKVSEANMKEGEEALKELRPIRYGVQNIIKHNKSLLNDAKKKMEDELNVFIDVTKPIEDEIDSSVKQIKAERKRKKEEAERLEKERIRKAIETVSSFRNEMKFLVEFANKEEHVSDYMQLEKRLNEFIETEELQEYTFELKDIQNLYGSKVSEIKAKVQVFETQRKENELLKKQIEESKQEAKKIASEVLEKQIEEIEVKEPKQVVQEVKQEANNRFNIDIEIECELTKSELSKMLIQVFKKNKVQILKGGITKTN